MSTVLPTPIDLDPHEASPYPVRRWTVDEFRRLREAGVLPEDDRLELLDGWIVTKMTQNPPHARVVQLVNRLLMQTLPPEWGLRVQLPIETADSEPEPDFAVVPEIDDRFATRHPVGREVPLVIEIADTSLFQDRQKAEIYARAGIAEYWIVDVTNRRIERRTHPDTAHGEYAGLQTYPVGEAIPLRLADQEIGSLSVQKFFPVTPG